jgi:hypothetical protein
MDLLGELAKDHVQYSPPFALTEARILQATMA